MKSVALLLFFFINLNCFASGWVQKADFGGIARHRTTMLTIGNKVYIGLGHYNGAGPNVLFDDWWEYDPSTNSWAQKANYLGGLCYHTTGFTMNNIAYVGTGRTSPTGSTLVQNFYKYDASTNSWTEITSFPGTARRGAVSFVIGDYAYVGSGESTNNLLGSFYRFDPSNESWLQVAFLPVVRTSAVGFSLGNFGYVGTGDTDQGSSNDFWQYDPALDLWTQKADVGPQVRMEAMGFALNGLGYLGTGGDIANGASFGDIWEYTPATDSWLQIEDFLGTSRRFFSATTLNGVAYACMGTNGVNFKDLWIFDQTISLIERGLEKMDIVAFPNPTSNQLHFKVDWPSEVNTEKIQLEIINANGQRVFSSIWSELSTIETESWNAGNYVYSIRYNDQIVHSENLIIQ